MTGLFHHTTPLESCDYAPHINV